MTARLLAPEELEAIRAGHAAATKGPWRWLGNTKMRDLYLGAPRSGHAFVINFWRWGMNGAQPAFERDGVMVNASELVEYEVPYRRDITGIDHPDARFIARSWETVGALLSHIDAREGEEVSTYRDALAQIAAIHCGAVMKEGHAYTDLSLVHDETLCPRCIAAAALAAGEQDAAGKALFAAADAIRNRKDHP